MESGLELPKIDALPTFTSAFTSSIVSNTTTTLTNSPEKYANLTSSSNQSKGNPSITLPNCNSASNSLTVSPNETIVELHQLNNPETQSNTPTHRSIIPDPSASLIPGLKNKKDQNKKLLQSKKKPTRKGIWKMLVRFLLQDIRFFKLLFFLFYYFHFCYQSLVVLPITLTLFCN